MTVVENRSLGDGELSSAVQADVENSGQNRFYFRLARLRVDTPPGAGLPDVLRNALARAVDAFYSFGPAHVLQKVVAGSLGFKLFGVRQHVLRVEHGTAIELKHDLHEKRVERSVDFPFNRIYLAAWLGFHWRRSTSCWPLSSPYTL